MEIEGRGRSFAIGRASLICALALFTALSATAPADAARVTIRDVRGDADPPWDITKVIVNNAGSALRIEVHHRGALKFEYPMGLLTRIELEIDDPANSASRPYLSPAPPELVSTEFFSLSMLRGSNSSEVPNGTKLTRGSKPVRCRGIRGRMRARQGLVLFVVPQRCFGSFAGRVRIAGSTYQPRGLPEEADYVDRWSRWIKRGA